MKEHIIHGFVEVIIAIDAAEDIHDLQQRPSLNYKRMKGKKNRVSLRINNKYRLEADIDWENKEKTVGTFGIQELSNHYE